MDLPVQKHELVTGTEHALKKFQTTEINGFLPLVRAGAFRGRVVYARQARVAVTRNTG